MATPKFTSVQDFISHLPKGHDKIAEEVISLTLNLSPTSRVELKWNCPVVIYHKHLFYINQEKEGLILGFMAGKELSNEYGLLTPLKLVSKVYLLSYNDYLTKQEAILRTIKEAMLINELNHK